MKELEDEYRTLQRKVWRASPEFTRREDVQRLREIRKQIGNDRALELQREVSR
jgi:hypothetical protein